MRLIDGDALIEKCGEWYTEEGPEEGFIGTLKQLLDKQPTVNPWIPCSERLPKENECVGNVWKYHLIQDEYEDMHVAHLSSRGWETIESFKALECDVVAWMPLPEPYKEVNK